MSSARLFRRDSVELAPVLSRRIRKGAVANEYSRGVGCDQVVETYLEYEADWCFTSDLSRLLRLNLCSSWFIINAGPWLRPCLFLLSV